MRYKITVSDRNHKIYNRNGQFLRTPTTIYFDVKDKLFWEMQLLKKGITGYIIESIEEPVKVKEPPRITISKEPVRPSHQRRGN